MSSTSIHIFLQLFFGGVSVCGFVWALLLGGVWGFLFIYLFFKLGFLSQFSLVLIVGCVLFFNILWVLL